jgi:hypothetical protein
MDAGDTTPRTGEVERNRKPEPRTKKHAIVENTEYTKNTFTIR